MVRRFLIVLAFITGGSASSAANLDAVGRIELDGAPTCTGALVAPDLVLTAAHCLFDPSTGLRLDAGRFSFGAGWQGNDHRAYRNVSDTAVHPLYEYKSPDEAARLRRDMALLRLSHPIPVGTVPALTFSARPRVGETLRVATFGRNRAVQAHPCKVISRQVGVFVTSCAVDYGHSGAPILRISQGRAQIVSVVAAKGRTDGQAVSLGAPVQDGLSAVMDALTRR
ncbi:MAG: trypsin-like serine peptidase [Primorskyibacter sp.]